MTKRKAVQPDLIDLLLADHQKPEDLIGENGILKQLAKTIIERALQAELVAHLGHGKHKAVSNEAGYPQRQQRQDPQRRFRRAAAGHSARP